MESPCTTITTGKVKLNAASSAFPSHPTYMVSVRLNTVMLTMPISMGKVRRSSNGGMASRTRSFLRPRIFFLFHRGADILLHALQEAAGHLFLLH